MRVTLSPTRGRTRGKRFDPTTGGRKQNLLRTIISPGWCSLLEKIIPKILIDEKSWKSNQKIVMNEESVQNSVMNEERLVQNGVMNDKFVKNFVMNAKIDPKVVMDLSIFQIGGWNSSQPINQKLLEKIF